MFQLPYTDHLERESASLKCGVCKDITEQKFIPVVPIVPEDSDFDPLKHLSLSKRLIICTKCGTMSLKN